MTNATKETVPPYLAVSRMDKVLELARTRTLNEVSTSLFSTYGFSTTDAALAVKFLKFIGAVDDDGKATETMKELRWEAEDRRKQAFASIVRNAYAKLFDAVKEPYNLPRTELADEFKVQYNQSTRITETALPVFLKLCEYAGFVEAGTVGSRTVKPRGEKKPNEASGRKSVLRQASAKPKHGTVATQEDTHVQHIIKGKMMVTIPEEIFLRSATDDDLNDAWRAVLKAAHAFADSYLQDETPKPDAGSGDGSG